jgi:protein phosphatase 1 regulatory subunit 42
VHGGRGGGRGGRRNVNGRRTHQQSGSSSSEYQNNRENGPRHRATKTPTQFTIDIDGIRTGVEKRSTIMVRNIPNRYTREGLLDDINEFLGTFDFFYLPMDLSAHSNVGYAFINFPNVSVFFGCLLLSFFFFLRPCTHLYLFFFRS